MVDEENKLEALMSFNFSNYICEKCREPIIVRTTIESNQIFVTPCKKCMDVKAVEMKVCYQVKWVSKYGIGECCDNCAYTVGHKERFDTLEQAIIRRDFLKTRICSEVSYGLEDVESVEDQIIRIKEGKVKDDWK